MTRVAAYARVSTSDKDQDPETQLMALRDFCRANDWDVVKEYIDRASARDLAHRKAWRELLDDCAKRRCKVVVVFKLDRAFRSVKDMHDTPRWRPGSCWGSSSGASESSSIPDQQSDSCYSTRLRQWPSSSWR